MQGRVFSIAHQFRNLDVYPALQGVKGKRAAWGPDVVMILETLLLKDDATFLTVSNDVTKHDFYESNVDAFRQEPIGDAPRTDVRCKVGG